MKKIMECMEAVIKEAFAASGYDEKFARVNVSNRPDLCEYQSHSFNAFSDNC